MDIKYYICMGTDIETLPFYPLAEGISKVVLRGNASYYSGTYIGTGEPFYHMIEDEKTFSFEGIYKKTSPLHDFFITSYFQQASTDKVGVVCQVDDIIYFSEGYLEIESLESGPTEVAVEGSVILDIAWTSGDIEDIIIAGQTGGEQSSSSQNDEQDLTEGQEPSYQSESWQGTELTREISESQSTLQGSEAIYGTFESTNVRQSTEVSSEISKQLAENQVSESSGEAFKESEDKKNTAICINETYNPYSSVSQFREGAVNSDGQFGSSIFPESFRRTEEKQDMIENKKSSIPSRQQDILMKNSNFDDMAKNYQSNNSDGQNFAMRTGGNNEY